MALDLLGLGVSMLRCLAGSAVGFMVSKGIRSAALESGGSIRTFLQKDIDQIREKLDSLAQSKLSAALQNIRQGLILLDQQFSLSGPPISCSSSSTSDLESAVSLCITSRTVLSEIALDIPADVRNQFQLAQQLAIEAFHDKRNVPALLRVESLKLQLFCTMLIHYQQPERWLGLWTVILEESMKDKELATAAAAICESGGLVTGSTTKSALALFWRKSNTDLSQAMCHLVENLHCALMAALWHPNVDARVAFGRSRILQYPRLLLCRPAMNQNSPHSGPLTVNLEAPFLYPWRADRVVVVLPSVYKLLSLYPTNKIMTAQIRMVPAAGSHSSMSSSFSLKILDILTLTEDEALQLDTSERLLDVDFDRTTFNLIVLSSTAGTGLSLTSYNLQFEKNSTINLSFPMPCTQVICDPVSGAVIAFEGRSPEDEIYVLKQSKASKSDSTELTQLNWFSYENIFKCMLTDRPGSIRISYAKPYRIKFGDDEASVESGLELLLYNRFTDVTYSLVTSFSGEEEINSTSMDSSDGTTPISSVSTISMDDDNMTKIQPVYPLKTPLLKVRVVEDENSSMDRQKVMLEKGAIFEHDELVWAKEKCLAAPTSAAEDTVQKAIPSKSEPAMIGTLVSNNESSTLTVFEVIQDEIQFNAHGMRYKAGERLELPLLCEQVEDRYLGGVVWFGKFVFVGTLMCKVKLSDD